MKSLLFLPFSNDQSFLNRLTKQTKLLYLCNTFLDRSFCKPLS